MDTEFPEQESDSDLCVHRVSLRGFAAAAKCFCRHRKKGAGFAARTLEWKKE
jgi:hypothetical protein